MNFNLEKTWRASGTGTTTFNTSSNIAIPYGKYSITVEGKGANGNANIPGNSNYNPPTGQNTEYYNSPNPGNHTGYNAPYYVPSTPWGPQNWAGTATFNPAGPGNVATYNPLSPGNYATTNPNIPGNAGGNSSALGVTLPGGPAAQTAPVTTATIVSYYAYPDSNTYPVTVASGGYVTIKIL